MNGNKVDIGRSKASLNIQAILFDKEKHSSPAAMKWLKKHHFAPIKRQHLTENYRRYRIHDPTDFIEKSFRTIDIGDGSIKMIIGKLKE
jgi:hypothetical protein